LDGEKGQDQAGPEIQGEEYPGEQDGPAEPGLQLASRFLQFLLGAVFLALQGSGEGGPQPIGTQDEGAPPEVEGVEEDKNAKRGKKYQNGQRVTQNLSFQETVRTKPDCASISSRSPPVVT
jgi:hypothetical protein